MTKSTLIIPDEAGNQEALKPMKEEAAVHEETSTTKLGRILSFTTPKPHSTNHPQNQTHPK